VLQGISRLFALRSASAISRLRYLPSVCIILNSLQFSASSRQFVRI
jgi:hypothetical protein